MTCTLKGPKEGSYRGRRVKGGDREKSITLVVLSDSSADTEDDVLTAAGVEQGDTYNLYGTTDDTCYCTDREASKNDLIDGGGALWEVDLKFSSNPGGDKSDNSGDNNGGNNGGETSKDPLDRWSASWDTEFKPAALYRAYLVTVDGNGNVTAVAADLTAPAMSNGEPADTKQSYSKAIEILRVTQNMATFDDAQALLYAGACNSDQFRGKAAGLWKCRRRSGEWQNSESTTSDSTGYWRVTTELAYDPEGWDVKFKDMGMYEILPVQAGGYEAKNIRDKRGQNVSKPWGLDGAGAALSVANQQAGNFVYRRYRPPPAWQQFAALNLPPVP